MPLSLITSFSLPLSHGNFVLKTSLYDLCVLSASAVQSAFSHALSVPPWLTRICIFGGFLSHIRGCGTDICDAADTPDPTAALSGFSRVSRLPVVSFQRLAPLIPPAISAGNMQKLQFLQ